MDSITQIVLGAAVGEAVAGKQLNRKAALFGAIGGTIPDLDVFANLFLEPLEAALTHRGFSHSILFALLISPLLGFLLHRLYKGRYTFKIWTALFFWSILTHPLLDIFTNYGTSLFWPLNTRISINSIFVVDPIYTIPFALLLVTALFFNNKSKTRRRLNNTGLILSTAYLAWGLGIKLYVKNTTEKLIEEKHIASEIKRVSPMPTTTFYWSILTEDSENYYLSYKSIFNPKLDDYYDIIPKNRNLFANKSWRNEEDLENLKLFSKNYFCLKPRENNIQFFDIRFGTSSMLTAKQSTDPIMGFELEVDDNTITRVNRMQGGKRFDNIDLDYYFKHVFNKP